MPSTAQSRFCWFSNAVSSAVGAGAFASKQVHPKSQALWHASLSKPARVCQVDLPSQGNQDFGTLFAEELGLVLEVAPEHEQQVLQAYRAAGLDAHPIGRVTAEPFIAIYVDGHQQIAGQPSAVTPPCSKQNEQQVQQDSSTNLFSTV